MKKVFDLFEYHTAKRVNADSTKILAILKKAHSDLAKYIEYKDVNDVLVAIRDAATMLKIHKEKYDKILNKGRTDEKNRKN